MNILFLFLLEIGGSTLKEPTVLEISKVHILLRDVNRLSLALKTKKTKVNCINVKPITHLEWP